MKRFLCLLASVAMAVTVFADPLRICPACGREDLKGLAKCASCGAALPPLPGKAEASPAEKGEESDLTGEASSTGAFAAAAKDVAEARARRIEDPGAALALYENALALLAADSGENFNERAAEQIETELEKCRAHLKEIARGSFVGLQKPILDGSRSAAVFFKAEGRKPFGRVWVPADWPSRLSPASLAAVRHALQPVCKGCNGFGTVPCAKCKGKGRVPCDYPGCKQGWIAAETRNNLGGTGRRSSATLKTRERCPLCKGTAFRPCPGCRGTAQAICKKCGGNGEAPLCQACQGMGVVTCKKCARAIEKGERETPLPGCLDCRGTGEVLCRKCGGDGRIRR